MSAKGMLVAMVAGSALVVVLATRHSEPEVPERVQPLQDEAWLTPEAAAQIVGSEGALGPLFAGVQLGGPEPTPEIRARVAAFARANHVDLDFEVVAGKLVSVRFDVTFHGCCGYEGADVLALKLGRPSTGNCCVCGPDTWINDWAVFGEDGIHMHGRVRVNRVVARWERTVTRPELLERADRLLGMDPATVREAAGDRWLDITSDLALLEVAYPFTRYLDFGAAVQLKDRDDLGVQLVAAGGRITEVSFTLHNLDDDTLKDLRAAVRARWGRPHTKDQDTWTWRTPDRTITAELENYQSHFKIQKR